MMRVVFIGTVEFSRSCLQAMVETGVQIVGIFTQSKAQAWQNSDWADLSPYGAICRAPVVYFEKISSPMTLESIRSLQPDVIFVLGLSQLLPRTLLQIAPLGVIGSHPALLPENRGRHPLIWALVKGLTRTGLTFFYIDEGVDSGDIILQREIPIAITDTAWELYGKVKQWGAEMVKELIPLLIAGKAPRIPQDHSRASYLRKRNPSDGLIRWEEGSWNSYNLIRALTRPYVGAHTFYGGIEVKVWKALPPEGSMAGNGGRHRPGEILGIDGQGITVWASDGPLRIQEIDLKPESLRVGEVFGNG